MVLMSGWIAADCVDRDRLVEPVHAPRSTATTCPA